MYRFVCGYGEWIQSYGSKFFSFDMFLLAPVIISCKTFASYFDVLGQLYSLKLFHCFRQLWNIKWKPEILVVLLNFSDQFEQLHNCLPLICMSSSNKLIWFYMNSQYFKCSQENSANSSAESGLLKCVQEFLGLSTVCVHLNQNRTRLDKAHVSQFPCRALTWKSMRMNPLHSRSLIFCSLCVSP